MIRHILLFSFRSTIDADMRTSVLEGLAEFPARFSKMQRFQIGANISNRDNTFEYVMTMEFEQRAYLDDYLHSDFHEQFVVERFRPVISQRAIATIEAK